MFTNLLHRLFSKIFPKKKDDPFLLASGYGRMLGKTILDYPEDFTIIHDIIGTSGGIITIKIIIINNRVGNSEVIMMNKTPYKAYFYSRSDSALTIKDAEIIGNISAKIIENRLELERQVNKQNYEQRRLKAEQDILTLYKDNYK